MPSKDNGADLLITGVIIISIIVILIGFNITISGKGVLFGCYLLATTLGISVLMSIFYIRDLYVNSRLSIPMLTTITVANVILLVSLITFIVILQINTENVSNPYISEYSRVYIEWFIITVVIITFINFSMKQVLNMNANDVPKGAMVLFANTNANILFILAEVIILIAYLYIVYLIFQRYPVSG